MGMRITRVHAVIKFTQTALFKKYIDDNSARRQLAADDFTKDYYKLLNNALYGKTMENVRDRKKFTLRNSAAQMLLDTSKPQYLRSVEFSEDLMLNELMNLEVRLDKPIFIGQAVLDLSKLECANYDMICCDVTKACSMARYQSLVGTLIVCFARLRRLTSLNSSILLCLETGFWTHPTILESTCCILIDSRHDLVVSRTKSRGRSWLRPFY
jgi:hypothetical protein